MRATTPAFASGGTAVYVINVGDFQVNLMEIFGDAANKYFDKNSIKTNFPSNSILITKGRTKIIVDPGDSAKITASMPSNEITPPRFSPLAARLTNYDVDPADITHVVVTHLHDDHFAGITRRAGDGWVPSFPRAEHFVPRKDWLMPEIAEARSRIGSSLQETLGVIEKDGLLQLVDGLKELGPGIALEPCPGESPGHQIVSLTSDGNRCYCIGDLYHVREEVEHPELMAIWTDKSALLGSRTEFSKRSSGENALVLSAHMEPGRISLVGGQPRWVEP